MWISTKGKNAVKVMIDLGMYNTGEPVKVKDIARRQDISDKYLEQIIAMLNKAGLVKSIRGAKGGYVLNDSTDKITVGMILEAAEGDMSVVDNLGEVTGDNFTDIICDRFWSRLDKAVREVLDSNTLADLVEEQKALLSDQYII
ncbi:MAG: Rrf2 family transcriptional regulator [Lachnospiraceae bacterium]|nr:Rrf2 family transcriptional regulator [Lachnospiraceae bacterium]